MFSECVGEEEVVEIVESCIYIVMAYVSHKKIEYYACNIPCFSSSYPVHMLPGPA